MKPIVRNLALAAFVLVNGTACQTTQTRDEAPRHPGLVPTDCGNTGAALSGFASKLTGADKSTIAITVAAKTSYKGKVYDTPDQSRPSVKTCFTANVPACDTGMFGSPTAAQTALCEAQIGDVAAKIPPQQKLLERAYAKQQGISSKLVFSTVDGTDALAAQAGRNAILDGFKQQAEGAANRTGQQLQSIPGQAGQQIGTGAGNAIGDRVRQFIPSFLK